MEISKRTPIFKRKAENYRPISLTTVHGKTLERCIREKLLNISHSTSLHGFLAGKSCVTQMLEFMEYITEAIDNGEVVDIVTIDFCKAFDELPHKKLLHKLHNY